jgi:hypothetical protein
LTQLCLALSLIEVCWRSSKLLWLAPRHQRKCVSINNIHSMVKESHRRALGCHMFTSRQNTSIP